VLKKYLSQDGNVYYEKLKRDYLQKNHPLKKYLFELSQVKAKEYSQWKNPEKKSFLINSYNAFTIKLVLDHYPLSSITDIGGIFWAINKKPWKMEFFSLLDGNIKSLDPIEHSYLRSSQFKDYRIHAALNCASLSCPPLLKEAYVEGKIDSQLDKQMVAWLNNPQLNTFNNKESSVKISKIFYWYKDDFIKWGGGIEAVLKKYVPQKMLDNFNKKVKISYLKYNWNLNDASSEKNKTRLKKYP